MSNLKTISAPKTFTNLNVNKLNIQSINGIQFNDIAIKSNDSLRLKGNVVFEKSVLIEGDMSLVSGLVNDIVIGEEIVGSHTHSGKLSQ